MEQCLRNFYSSETFGMLKELPQQMWLEVEDFSSFNLNNTKDLGGFRLQFPDRRWRCYDH